MLVLDVTVVNVALPDIGVALHLQRGELPWVMTIYTVFFGGLMLLGGPTLFRLMGGQDDMLDAAHQMRTASDVADALGRQPRRRRDPPARAGS